MAELHVLVLARVGPDRSLDMVRRLGSLPLVQAIAIGESLRAQAVELL